MINDVRKSHFTRPLIRNKLHEIKHTKIRKKWQSFPDVRGGCNTFSVHFSPSSPSVTLIYFLTSKWANFLLLLTIIISAILGRITQQLLCPFRLMEDEKCHRRKKNDDKTSQESDSAVNDDKFQLRDLYLMRCLMKEWNLMQEKILLDFWDKILLSHTKQVNFFRYN